MNVKHHFPVYCRRRTERIVSLSPSTWTLSVSLRLLSVRTPYLKHSIFDVLAASCTLFFDPLIKKPRWTCSFDKNLVVYELQLNTVMSGVNHIGFISLGIAPKCVFLSSEFSCEAAFIVRGDPLIFSRGLQSFTSVLVEQSSARCPSLYYKWGVARLDFKPLFQSSQWFELLRWLWRCLCSIWLFGLSEP